ncbi:MAG: helix-turn-helix domain-containing protein, partial [Aquiluna sp.]
MSRRISGGRLQGSYGVHSNTGVRKSNLSQVLTLVHTFGRLTRSDIGLKTGLNRSTVLDLVAELQDLGLVRQEVPSGAGEVGRPSVEVIASDSVVSFVVIPRLGELTVGTVGLGGRIFAQKRVSMPENATAQD